MHFRTSVIVFLLAAGLSPVPVSSETAGSCIHGGHRNALVFIEAEYKDANGQMQTAAGTGFIVSKEGHVLTSSHVVPAAGNSGLKLMGRVATRFAFPVLLEAVDRGSVAGLALLKLTDPGTGYTPVVLGRSKRMNRGSDILAMGFPLTSESSSVEGFVANTLVRSGDAIPPGWQTSLALDPGHGGGPVFDSRGAVVGIAAARLKDADAIGRVIPIDSAAPLLRLASISRRRTALPHPSCTGVPTR
jgi:S1-C subfamily serine protease